MSIAVKVSCISNAVRFMFLSAAQRDQWVLAEAILEDFCIVLQAGGSQFRKERRIDGFDRTDQREFPFGFNLCCDLKSMPRFGAVELEAREDAGLLTIALPPLPKLPWPYSHGAIEAEQHLRAARERLAWGISRGELRTKLAAAEYLRQAMPVRARTAITFEAWKALLDGTGLPAR